MWILCYAEHSYETSSLIFFENKSKKIKVSSAAIFCLAKSYYKQDKTHSIP